MKKLRNFGGVFDLEGKKNRWEELKKEAEKPEVWKDHRKTQALNQEKSHIEKSLESWKQLNEKLEELSLFLEMAGEEKDEKAFLQLKQDLNELFHVVEKKEIQNLLSGESDINNSYLSIHAGAGGTEAADWAQILYRMYLRWAEKQNFQTELLSLNEGEEAGIKSVSFLIKGTYSYGLLKGESGVHRLVRVSPFDSNARRHTSFASVFAWPEIDDKIEVDIRAEDIRIDTYRASGAGGQHVNRTDSAVRITHLPTGLVVQCQNGRSQHANKDKAMKMLKAAIYRKEMEKKEEEKKKRESSKKANEWGSQIRSYVLHPYQMVKDHRTNVEHPRPKEVLDGDIDIFVESVLKQTLS